MAQFVFVRPLGEADLGDELWLHAVRAATRQLITGECARRRFQLRKLPAQAPQRLSIESRADFARIYQRSAIVIAHEQRSEADPLPARLRVTDDDELLLLPALEFEPVARSPGYVHT